MDNKSNELHTHWYAEDVLRPLSSDQKIAWGGGGGGRDRSLLPELHCTLETDPEEYWNHRLSPRHYEN